MDRSTERVFDEYLAASARAGSRPALGRLAERWHGRLLAHAVRLTGDHDGARDVVQDAWVEIVRGLARLDDVAAFPAWAYRIVTRRCARWVRRAQRHRQLVAQMADERSVAADDPTGRADAQRVVSAMAQLPRDQYATMGLFYLEELSVTETAAALGVPAGTVKTRLMHARNKIRRSLGVKENEHERT
jgi:RNA polymerase sigma-70 factor (ECF subfamily)